MSSGFNREWRSAIMGIDLLDHIVIGDGVFVSLKERGLI
jgi:DNA repair protein RadC